MQSHFEQELTQLKDTLLTMAGRAESVVNLAMEALMNRDDEAAIRVEQQDNAIDQLEIEIDDKAISLLSKAPLASDLRLITVAMQAAHDLERVGDEATTIARRSIMLNQEAPLKEYVDLPHMAKKALAMLKDALDGFVNGDTEKARAVVPSDKEVDALNKRLYRELADLMKDDSSVVERGLSLIFIARSLERIADHAANIAEEVVFLHEGKDIRHAAAPASMD